MTEERRKHLRYKCLLPAEVLTAEGKDRFMERISVHDFSRGGLKLIINFITLDPGSDMELKLYLQEKRIKTSLKAEIAWKKLEEDKLEVGLKIKEMNKNLKSEILNWVFPKWLERERERRKKSRRIF